MAKDLKLRMYTTNKMFDLEKLINKDIKLFEELCEKYPLKKECVFMVKYDTEPSPAPVIPVSATNEAEEPKNEQKEEIVVSADTDTKNAYEKIEYPKDFEPLYKVGEKTVLRIANDTITEHIEIQKIKPKCDGGKIIDYYYSYIVEETGEVKTMAEAWLVDHEVNN